MLNCLFCCWSINLPNSPEPERQNYIGHMQNDHPDAVLIVLPKSEAFVWFEFAMNFAELRMNGPETRIYEPVQPQIDSARNEACDFAMSNEIPWIFFQDTDILLPKDTLYRLLKHKEDVVSVLYARRHQPTWNEMLIEVKDTQGHDSLMSVGEGEYPKEALIAVDCVGTGGLLIRTEVLREIERPIFSWGVGVATAGRSEDFTMMRKLRRHGIQVYCDTSIVARHINYVKVKPTRDVNNINIDFPQVGLF